jgi:hypothetical protein
MTQTQETAIEFVEFRVRKVERYIVTRYEHNGRSGGVATIGEYASEDTAMAVGYALCKAEHERSGEPIGSMKFIYPETPTSFTVSHMVVG